VRVALRLRRRTGSLGRPGRLNPGLQEPLKQWLPGRTRGASRGLRFRAGLLQSGLRRLPPARAESR
jgi:hypothetical protein